MYSEKKQSPRVRFSGFRNVWEKHTLNELYEKNTEKNDGKFSVNKTISIAKMYFNPDGNGASENSISSYKVLRTGDIAFEGHENKNYKYGRMVMNDIGDGIMSPRFTTLRPKKNQNISFWKILINYEPVMKKILVNSTKKGTMMNELVVEDFLSQSICFPSEQEQAKIGQFFKELDDLIAVNQREGKKLEDLKRAYLDKLFPKNGDDKPELRFPGFNNPWEKRKLKDISTIYSGGTPSSANAAYWNGTVNWFTPTEVKNNGYVSDSIRKITKVGLKSSSAVLLPKNTIMMTSRAGIGEMAILKVPATTNQGIQSFILNENISPYFFYSMQPQISKLANSVASGSTFTEISGKKLGNIALKFTFNEKEQTKIGEFFKKLDDLIAVNQRERKKLEQLKKAYLKDMFV